MSKWLDEGRIHVGDCLDRSHRMPIVTCKDCGNLCSQAVTTWRDEDGKHDFIHQFCPECRAPRGSAPQRASRTAQQPVPCVLGEMVEPVAGWPACPFCGRSCVIRRKVDFSRESFRAACPGLPCPITFLGPWRDTPEAALAAVSRQP